MNEEFHADLTDHRRRKYRAKKQQFEDLVKISKSIRLWLQYVNIIIWILVESFTL